MFMNFFALLPVHPILIMEYTQCGDLLGYLRKCRGVKDRYYLGEGRAQELETYDLVLFAKQIATGMMFLGSRGVSKQQVCHTSIYTQQHISKALQVILNRSH